MIEIIQNDLKERGSEISQIRKLTNVRQVGFPDGRTRIYMEDYVNTYLHQMSGKNEECVGILLGKNEEINGDSELYISGAIGFCSDSAIGERTFFQEEAWQKMYEIMRKYFDTLEIVGWYQVQQSGNIDITPEMNKVRQKYFPGEDKVMFLLELPRKIGVFYAVEQGITVRKNGYYIYYERNPQMQEYMVQARTPKRQVEKETLPIAMRTSDEQREDIVENYRNIINMRQEDHRRSNDRWHSFMYAMSGLMIFVVAVIGVTMMSSVEQIRRVEAGIEMLVGKEATTKNVQKKDEAVAGSSVIVEKIDGDVEPQDVFELKDEDGKKDILKEDPKQSETEKPETEKPDTEKSETEKSETEKPDTEKSDAEQLDTEQADTEKRDTGNQQSTAEAEKYISQGYYEVQKGDSLDKICKKIYNTTAFKKNICELNGIIDEDHLTAGQRLKLP